MLLYSSLRIKSFKLLKKMLCNYKFYLLHRKMNSIENCFYILCASEASYVRLMAKNPSKFNEISFSLLNKTKRVRTTRICMCLYCPIGHTCTRDILLKVCFFFSSFIPFSSFFYHYRFGDRFVEPFSDLIHSWEKTLSLIYEIIDQWVNFTQRKWLYLEGIFVANDARIKLPTIADKFDRIDAEYIKV